MKFLRLASIPLAAMLLGAVPMPKVNWDKIAWGMTVPEAQKAYPSGRYENPFLDVDQAAIAKHSALAGLIEKDTRVLFHFAYRGGSEVIADYVEFIVPGAFNDIAKILKRKYGKPISGADNESACFDADGNRKSSDPSGVGHILVVCEGAAIFMDKRGGNVIYLGRDARADVFRKTLSYAPYQTVRIGAIAECLECGNP